MHIFIFHMFALWIDLHQLFALTCDIIDVIKCDYFCNCFCGFNLYLVRIDPLCLATVVSHCQFCLSRTY